MAGKEEVAGMDMKETGLTFPERWRKMLGQTNRNNTGGCHDRRPLLPVAGQTTAIPLRRGAFALPQSVLQERFMEMIVANFSVVSQCPSDGPGNSEKK